MTETARHKTGKSLRDEIALKNIEHMKLTKRIRQARRLGIYTGPLDELQNWCVSDLIVMQARLRRKGVNPAL